MTGEELDVLQARCKELRLQAATAECQFAYAYERYFRFGQMEELFIKAASKGLPRKAVMEHQARMQRDAHRLWNKYFWDRIEDCTYG